MLHPLSYVRLVRDLPPSVMKQSACVLFLIDQIIYRTLLDSGSQISFIDHELAIKLKLNIKPLSGKVRLAHCDKLVDRIGVTYPVDITALFPASTVDLPAITFACSFEVLPLDRDRYSFLIGTDMIRPILFPYDNIPSEFIPITRSATSNSYSVINPKCEAITVLDESKHNSEDNNLSLFDTLEITEDGVIGTLPANEAPVRVQMSITPELEASYAESRGVIMNDPDVRAAIEINDKLKGFCNIPESVVHLEIDPAKQSVLFRKQFPLPHSLIPRITEIVNRWFEEGRIVRAPPNCPYNNPLLAAPEKR